MVLFVPVIEQQKRFTAMFEYFKSAFKQLCLFCVCRSLLEEKLVRD